MVGPIDYTMQVLDPIQGYMKGLAFGEDLQNSQLGREQTRQTMGIQQTQEARAAQEFEMRKAEAARKQADAQRGQQVLGELLSNPSPTSEDFTKAYLANPAIREEVKFLMGNQSAEVTKAQLSSAQNLYAAAAQNNLPIVERLLTEQRDAAKNGGNEQMYQLADEGLKMLQSDPEMAMKHVRTSTGLSILGLGGDIKKINDAIGIGEPIEFRPATAEEAAQYGAASGQINTKTGEFKATGDKGPLVQNVMGTTETEAAKELGKGQAKQITATLEAGDIAARNLAELDRLEGLLENVSTGGIAAIKQWLGGMGIATEGVEDIQAVAASIARMIPKQREDGSGSSSNLDVQTFALALPSLINQPGGNKIIVDTMRAISEYDVAASIIAGQVSDYLTTPENERKALEDQGLILSPSNGRKAIRELGSPTSIYKEWASSKKGTPTASGDAKANFMADPRVQALAPPEREKAWNIYQQKVGK